MACLKGTGQILGLQVFRWIQKGLAQDIPTDVPHPIVVGAGRAQVNRPWGAQAPVLSLKSLFGEGRRSTEKSQMFLEVSMGY